MMAVPHNNNGQMLDMLLSPWLQAPPLMINDLTENASDITPGSLFIARAGLSRHGIDFVAQAETNGAAAVLAEVTNDWPMSRLQEASALPVMGLDNLSVELSAIASRFFSEPSKAMQVVGVTGTNGKSSVVYFLSQAWAEKGAQMGTLGIGRPGALQTATHTTVGAVEVQRTLADLRAQGFTHVAMEMSSHGLHQKRVADVFTDIGVLTNLSRDHFDYHLTREAYAAAKQALFYQPSVKTVVINAADPLGQVMIAQPPRHAKMIRYAWADAPVNAELRGELLHADIYGMDIEISGKFGDAKLHSNLLGGFNAENLLAVLGVLLAEGLSLDQAVEKVQDLTPPPGRLQRVSTDSNRAAVFVDYAHTPDAIRHVLATLRPFAKGRLICVFGAGGDRDKGKRASMGRAAASYADLLLLTDDNPRYEDGKEIIEQIQSGIPADVAHQVQRNRALAIQEAIAGSEKEDVVLIAGKGHETYQLVGDMRFEHDDVLCAQKALLGGRS